MREQVVEVWLANSLSRWNAVLFNWQPWIHRLAYYNATMYRPRVGLILIETVNGQEFANTHCNGQMLQKLLTRQN